MVIKPRGEKNEARNKGVVDPIRIALSLDKEYLKLINSISARDLLTEVQLFIYDRAWIDREKYKFLKKALYASAAGWVASSALAIWLKIELG